MRKIKGIDSFANTDCQNYQEFKCNFGKDKPFDCKFYPYAFILNKNYIEIYRDKNCPSKFRYSEKFLIDLSRYFCYYYKNWIKNYKKVLFDNSISGKYNGKLIIKYLVE